MKRIVSFGLITLVIMLSVSCSLLKDVPYETICPSCGTSSSSKDCVNCGFDKIIGTTLNSEDISALVNKTPAEIADSIKTVGDAILYLNESGMHLAEKEYDPNYGGSWSFARTGFEELSTNSYCSSWGLANYFSYVLADDYEEIGQITVCLGATHSLNYVLMDDVYYLFDLSSENKLKMTTDSLKLLSDVSVRKPLLNSIIEEMGLEECDYRDVYLVFSQETTADKPYGVPFYISGRIIHVPEGEEDDLSMLYWLHGGSPFKGVSLDVQIPGYNRKIKEINEFPGKVIKGHPLYKSN